MPNKLWVEKYRPSSIDTYVFQNERHRQKFTQYIEDGSIPHLLLEGDTGTGKTTLAFLLKNELGIDDTDFKVLNASDENSVDIIRNEIKAFAKTMPMGDFKIIFLDEADFLTRNAQGALRRLMEQYSDTFRFILTTNHPHKILDAIRSRCQEYKFEQFDKKEMAIHCYKILKQEGITVTDAELIKQYVDECYPDMRKLLQSLETNCVDGELQDYIEVGDTTKTLVSIVEQLSKGKWLEVRASIIENIEEHEWDDIYRFLYENLDQVDGFDDILNWKQGIVIIADHLRFHGQVAEPEINFSSCMIRLSGVIN